MFGQAAELMNQPALLLVLSLMGAGTLAAIILAVLPRLQGNSRQSVRYGDILQVLTNRIIELEKQLDELQQQCAECLAKLEAVGSSDIRPGKALHRQIADHYNADELDELIFSLGLDAHIEPNKNTLIRARDLVSYHQRRERVSVLLEALRRGRDQVKWLE